MKDFQPLNETELAAVKKVQSIFRGMNLIPCTACRYCTDGCPRQIAIPDLFARDEHQADSITTGTPTFTIIMSIPAPGRRASDCIQLRQVRKGLPSAPAHPQTAD